MANLRVIDPERISPRELAKEAIKRRNEKPRTPWIEISGSKGPVLEVDRILDESDPGYLVGRQL
jgi:hypothetical protein